MEKKEVEAYIVETFPTEKVEDYNWYFVLNDRGNITTYKLVPTTDNPKQIRKMTKTFEVVRDSTEDVMD